MVKRWIVRLQLPCVLFSHAGSIGPGNRLAKIGQHPGDLCICIEITPLHKIHRLIEGSRGIGCHIGEFPGPPTGKVLGVFAVLLALNSFGCRLDFGEGSIYAEGIRSLEGSFGVHVEETK